MTMFTTFENTVHYLDKYAQTREIHSSHSSDHEEYCCLECDAM